MQEGSLRAKSRRNAGVGITGRQAQAGSLVGCVLGSNPALCTESQVGRVCKQVEDWMSLNMLKTWVLVLFFFSSVHYSNYQIKIILYSNMPVSTCILYNMLYVLKFQQQSGEPSDPIAAAQTEAEHGHELVASVVRQ